jgi:hypothetical protein
MEKLKKAWAKFDVEENPRRVPQLVFMDLSDP